MAEITVVLPPGVGLHARPAALFVGAAAKSPLDVTIGRPGEPGVNAKSILGVMGLMLVAMLGFFWHKGWLKPFTFIGQADVEEKQKPTLP